MAKKKDVVNHYQKNLDVNYLVHPRGHKIPMPKYYRDRILDRKLKDQQIGIIKRKIDEKRNGQENLCEKYHIDIELTRILAKEKRQQILKSGNNERTVD